MLYTNSLFFGQSTRGSFGEIEEIKKANASVIVIATVYDMDGLDSALKRSYLFPDLRFVLPLRLMYYLTILYIISFVYMLLYSPGRLEEHIHIDFPSLSEREEILSSFMADLEITDAPYLSQSFKDLTRQLAAKTEGRFQITIILLIMVIII